jgi:hypothetical protein
MSCGGAPGPQLLDDGVLADDGNHHKGIHTGLAQYLSPAQ